MDHLKKSGSTEKDMQTDLPSEQRERLSVDLRQERLHISKIGFGIAVFVLVNSLIQFALLYLLKFLPGDLLGNLIVRNLLSPVSIYLFALPVLLLFLSRVPVGEGKKDRLPFGGWLLILVVAFGFMYIGNYIGIGVNALLSSLTGGDTSNPVAELMSMEILLVNILSVVIIAPIGEELIFRKLLMDRLNRYGGVTSILISGLAFGLMHGNFSQFFYATLLGFLLGYVYYRTGKIRLTITLHAAINLVGGILPTLISSELTKMYEEYGEMLNAPTSQGLGEMFLKYGWAIFGMLFMLVFMIATVITAVVIPIVLRKKIKLEKGDTVLPRGKRFQTVVLNAGMLLAFVLLAYPFIINLIP